MNLFHTSIIKQMSTMSRKRKGSVSESDSKKKNRVEEEQDLIFMVKCVQVGRGDFHYFGKTRNSQKQERLRPSWMRENKMSDSWRKRQLRGKNLNKWKTVPVGKKEKKILSMNPCVPGTLILTLIFILITTPVIILQVHFSRFPSS